MIVFREITNTDVELICNWLNSGESQKWFGFGKTVSGAEVEEKFIMRGKTNKRIIVYKGEDIGVIQWYKISDYPEYFTIIGGVNGDYGMDIFIGRDDLIGRGIGREVINLLIRDYICSYPDATRCVIGPRPNNSRAIKCYEKCGFAYSHTCNNDDGEEYIMTFDITKMRLTSR
jgi:RimJ/RimL family protein N-acetyltransferase